MIRNAQAVRIIAQRTGPDFPRLRAIAREAFRRARGMIALRGPRSEPDSAGPDDLPAMSLPALCREAVDALNPDAHKLYLGHVPWAKRQRPVERIAGS